MVGLYFIDSSNERARQEQRIVLSDIVATEAASIERRLSHSLATTYVLAQEVRRTNGYMPHFNQYAKSIMHWVGGVSNLQLAPDGIIRDVYPLQGNEKAIGHNIIVDDKRRDEALLAVKKRRLTLAGPFTLVQGGMGVIGRNPVFLERQDGEVFWGFASALIYLDDLLQSTGLEALEAKGYRYTLEKQEETTGQWQTFARSKHDIGEVCVEGIVKVPNGLWRIKLARKVSANTLWTLLLLAIVSIVAALGAYLTFRVLLEPIKLRELVKEKTKALEYLAFHDPLTGLASRRLLQEKINEHLQRVKHTDEILGLLYLDLDEFKRINDTMGHDMGDQLLQEIAQRIQACVRKTDVVSRFGGDEFAILLMGLHSKKDAVMVAKKVIDALSVAIKLRHREVVVTASIGITVGPDDGLLAEELLLNADLALYASKNNGKNQSMFFNHQMKQKMVAMLDMEEGLREGIRQDQFFLVFQPIVCMNSKRNLKFEALLRWEHPTQGLIYPDNFIEVAEQTGLIVPMGWQVLEKACEFVNRYTDTDEQTLTVTINISPRQFMEADFVSRTFKILSANNVSPENIVLEVTESMLMKDIDHALVVMAQLRRGGIRFSMDDFGTGYSSLAQLKQLPVCFIKIDRSFIMDICSQKEAPQIVEAIIAMSHKLGLKVVAEGIETQAQSEMLEKMGCEMGQGYLFSRPVTINQLLKGDIKYKKADTP